MVNLVSALFNNSTIIHDIDKISFVQDVKSVCDEDTRTIR